VSVSPSRFGLNHSRGSTVHEEQVIRLTMSLLHWEFADGDATGCRDIRLTAALYDPSAAFRSLSMF
jgi:hypothetical protein